MEIKIENITLSTEWESIIEEACCESFCNDEERKDYFENLFFETFRSSCMGELFREFLSEIKEDLYKEFSNRINIEEIQ